MPFLTLWYFDDTLIIWLQEERAAMERDDLLALANSTAVRDKILPPGGGTRRSCLAASCTTFVYARSVVLKCALAWNGFLGRWPVHSCLNTKNVLPVPLGCAFVCLVSSWLKQVNTIGKGGRHTCVDVNSWHGTCMGQ